MFKLFIKRKIKLKEALILAFIMTRSIGYGEIITEEYIQTDLNNVGKVEYKGNGIEISSINENLTNEGTIKGKVLLENITNEIDAWPSPVYHTNGNGIYIKNKLSNLENTGIVEGNSMIINSTNAETLQYNGNAIFSDVNTSIANIINKGTIIGRGESLKGVGSPNINLTGNGILIFGDQSSVENTEVQSIDNEGIISGMLTLTGAENVTYYKNAGQSLGSGNGISIFNNLYSNFINKLEILKNNGFIKGFVSSQTTDSSAKDNVYVSNFGEMIGNGVSISVNRSDSSIVAVENKGIINGDIYFKSANATNTVGNTFGQAYTKGISSGNGIALYAKNTNINDLINQGSIAGKGEFISGTTTQLRGQAYTDFYGIGNGISLIGQKAYAPLSAILQNIQNDGLVSGYISSTAGQVEGQKAYEKIEFSGNGISVNGDINVIKNNGVIKGSQSSIAANSINSVKNYGILAGREIYSDGVELIKNESTEIQKDLGVIIPINEKNHGIYIKLNSEVNGGNTTGKVTLDIDGNPIIESITNGEGGEITLDDGSVKTVLNGSETGNISPPNTIINISSSKSTADSYLLSSNLINDGNDLIINGAGIAKGALVINNDTALTDSIVNGYNTAVYVESEKTLTATNTTFNGGGLKNDIAVLKGDGGDNTLNILGNSIINGAVNLGNGTDTLTVANTVQINGKLDGGDGAQDTLNLGELEIAKVIAPPNLNILHDIAGFENINTNGNLTLFETVNVTGANNIILESGNLVLRVDPTVILDGKVTGHALYGNNGTLTSTGGNLVVGLNGLGENTTISMGGTTITPETNDSWWKDTDYIKTNSLVLDGKLSTDGKDISITVLESIPLEPSIPVPPVDPPVNPEPPVDPPVNPEPPVDPPVNPEPPVDPPVNPEPPVVVDALLYKKLNKVYQSIVAAGEIGNLANTTLLEDKTYNESLGGLLTILDQIYANNPYAYTLKSSRDSLKLFEDNMSYLTIKPKKDEMIVQGKAIYTGVKNDSNSSGKNYYGFDTGHRNYKTTTNTVGGLATFEYGLSDETSVGFVFGGNNQDINFKGSSKIKGNSFYLGTFAKTDINNFKFMSGIGYQYTSADADRKVSNRYDSFSTGDKYDINSLNAFVEAKYVYNAQQDWTVEPKARLSYYYIDQDKVKEGYTPGQISIRTDDVNSNTADVEIGVDFVKSLYLNTGKLKNILSLGVINTIGDKSKELNGYVLGKEKDGNKFDIQGIELPRTSGKVAYNLELEQTNGMIYTAGLNLEFAKDYNRNLNATVGIGYKF